MFAHAKGNQKPDKQRNRKQKGKAQAYCSSRNSEWRNANWVWDQGFGVGSADAPQWAVGEAWDRHIYECEGHKTYGRRYDSVLDTFAVFSSQLRAKAEE